MDSSPSLIVPPITGTMLLITKRRERMPRISARADTAVLIERIDTNAAAQKDTADVIILLSEDTSLDKFSFVLSELQMPIAIKQFISGTKKFDDKKDKPCDKSKTVVLVEKAVVIPPEAATIAQKTGTKA